MAKFPNLPGALNTPKFKDWMAQIFQKLVEHTDQKAQAVRNELIGAIKAKGTSESSDQPLMHPLTDPQPSKSTRQQLPHPEPFDGKDKALFEP